MACVWRAGQRARFWLSYGLGTRCPVLSHREHGDPARASSPHWDPVLGQTRVKSLWDEAGSQGVPGQDHLAVPPRKKPLPADQPQAVGGPVEFMAQKRGKAGCYS